jgi:alkylation response protein AidB-like acyl-CoA dehydrogenase
MLLNRTHANILGILEGTSEVQRVLIAREPGDG